MNNNTDINEPQHGDPVESWTIHSHSVLVICPKCRQPVSRLYQSHYKLGLAHFFDCSCGQPFGIKWQDKTQDAKVTIHTYIHTYIDIDIDDGE